jgi:uncharacterized protein
MKNFILSIITLLLSFSIGIKGQSSNIPEKPEPARLVNDYAGFLTTGEQAALEHKLVAINDSSTTQIAVVIVKSLNGYEINDFGTRIIQKWGIGQKDKNNGILILVKPKISGEKGEIAIVTGYGVEHLVTDALSKQIVENEIIPAFKNGQMYQGFDNAINTLYSLTRGEFTPSQYLVSHRKNKQTRHFPIILIIIILFFVITLFGKSSSPSGKVTTGSNLPFWLLMGGLLGSSGGRSEGTWGDFSSGGDDFGGFGGGDSGGGGASGSW